MGKIAVGRVEEATQADSIRAIVAELVCTFLFVFAGVGSTMAVDRLSESSGLTPGAGLAIIALTHAFAVCGLVSAGFHLSGGHINPAVTFALAVGGHITILRSILYWIAQLLGSTIACYLLVFITGGMGTPVHTLAGGMGYIQGVVMEMVLTFSLLFTVYATVVDPKRGPMGLIMAPLCIGLVVGANVMAAGPFSSASMNPARSFGPAFVMWQWRDHWVYWVGPLVGGGLAGALYENFFIIRTYEPLPASL